MKIFLCMLSLSLSVNLVLAQGCSDAGVCTIGDFYAQRIADAKKNVKRNEIDLSFTYGTHGKFENFYQPQLNFRHFKKNGSFFEMRLPLNISGNTALDATTTGIGDITTTYNNKFSLKKDNAIKYSLGIRISLSNADKSDGKSAYSYPMTLQSGLGTTDLLVAASYDLGKYFSVGTGVQVPVLQYNKNVAIFYPAGAAPIIGEGYRRQPDVLLKLTGHYQLKQLKMNGGVLGIYHLANDHYNTAAGKYLLLNSKGTTINWTIDLSYPLTKQWMISLLYAEPFKTRDNIPDGLARSRIVSPKITYSFK